MATLNRSLAVIASAMILGGCQSAPTVPAVSASVNNQGGHAGNITNTASLGNVTGSSASPNTTVDLKLALDPAAFAGIFGTAAVAKPTAEQLTKLSQVAQAVSDPKKSEILDFVRKCATNTANCEVAPSK